MSWFVGYVWYTAEDGEVCKRELACVDVREVVVWSLQDLCDLTFVGVCDIVLLGVIVPS